MNKNYFDEMRLLCGNRQKCKNSLEKRNLSDLILVKQIEIYEMTDSKLSPWYQRQSINKVILKSAYPRLLQRMVTLSTLERLNYCKTNVNYGNY